MQIKSYYNAIKASRQLFAALTLFFTLFLSCQAMAISGEGYGNSQAEASKEALSALSSSIFVQIESESTVYKNTEGTNFFESSINSKSDLPLFGTTLDCIKRDSEFYCQAELDKKKALPVYQATISKLVDEAQQQYEQLNKLEAAQQYDVLSSLQTQLTQLDRYYTVVFYLDRKIELAKTSFSQTDLVTKINKITEQLDSLDMASKILTLGIKQHNIFVSPAHYPNSHEVTPFASALLGKLQSSLSIVHDTENADYFFNGKYFIHKNHIQVDYSLTNNQGNVLHNRTINLSPKAYQGLEAKPELLDFDQLLHNGYVLASDLHIEIATNKGSRQLLFMHDETIKLLVKLNKPAWFYVLGHTKANDTEKSYLLDFYDRGGDYRFIQFVNADQVNRWITIGEFEVAPPFGVESLQVFAATEDPVGKLPAFRESKDGYFEVSNKMEKAVQLSRGLKRKKSNTAEYQEAVLMFTTRPKNSQLR